MNWPLAIYIDWCILLGGLIASRCCKINWDDTPFPEPIPPEFSNPIYGKGFRWDRSWQPKTAQQTLDDYAERRTGVSSIAFGSDAVAYTDDCIAIGLNARVME